MAEELARVGPDKPEFIEGLIDRNVFLDESEDPRVDHIKHLKPENLVPETEEQRNVHKPLWDRDQAKCDEGSSNEALFQRTMMMSLIARHCLIYERNILYFSVEETWTCHPMPTRAYSDNQPFLTQPKPDLAVCFRRHALVSDTTWYSLPAATRRLASYKSVVEVVTERVFHFCTIEAKKGKPAISDPIGQCQSLNNASQALHNMFEFFREAGPQHEEGFFTRVRFFSVVGSTEGLMIRIHRATREPADGSGRGWIVEPSNGEPGYPLRFEFQVFATIEKRDDFTREKVLETFENILLGYGENELRLLLRNATEAIVERFRNNPGEKRKRTSNNDFYRHGQRFPPNSRKPTPARSLARSDTNTPTEKVMNWLE
ncbi:MAG: hypothetical protein FRX48_08139 [Lasallia pustulata]|uniref:DUF7924 domain-containing protein n=1 Tax=Lasallia pustulata TaxID=136370 RepID=A0A5M8PGB9_9LECA|nr:MAG: hypothetical protein FRX48_08139 [Lasallia pustulata]